MKRTGIICVVFLGLFLWTQALAGYEPGVTDMCEVEQAWVTRGHESDSPYLDWRNYGGENYMSDAEYQYSSGLCWAFASSHGLVSRIKIVEGSTTAVNFSEDAIGDCVSPGGPYLAGNFWKAAGYFCWRGPVLESCQPWNMGTTYCNPACSQLDYRLRTMRTIGASTAAIKAALADGPVMTSMDSSCIPGFGSYNGLSVITSTGATTAIDHGVLIVGYHEGTGDPGYLDGDYWICKNSWDDTWGDNGYFYIGYGLAMLGLGNAQFIDWDDSIETVGGEILYEDESGASGAISAGTNALFACQRLVPTMDGEITQIQFANGGNNFTWTMMIYDSKSGGDLSIPLISQLSGVNEPYGGILTVDLPTPVSVTSGNDIYVAVRMHNPTDTYHPCDLSGTVSNQAFYSTTSISTGYADFSSGDWGIHAVIEPETLVPTATPTVGITTPSTGPTGITILLVIVGILIVGVKRR